MIILVVKRQEAKTNLAGGVEKFEKLKLEIQFRTSNLQ
jgi:hypothetical protein